jgi:mono/diheme cytochrome c family protein
VTGRGCPHDLGLKQREVRDGERLPAKDAVVIGRGWTGSILSFELCDAGLDVVAIERGPWCDTPTDFPRSYVQDELRYRLRHELFLRPAQMSLTFRNNDGQTSLPVRTWGAFMLGNGASGAGVHWNGETWRFLPSDFVLRSHLTERYGADFLPADMTLQDWGITFDELEPHYARFEYLCGTSATAGNLHGMIQPGGNPFEGPRSRPYPTAAQKQPFSHALFAEAAREMGYKPFPQPSGNLSQAYTNPLGVKLGPCTYCGFCEWCGCANYSKASRQTTILPALVRKPNFEARAECEVMRINLDSSRTRAIGVTYVDTMGNELEQPAALVLLCAVVGKSAEWNRGADLVEGLMHCGMCHMPKNCLGGDDTSRRLEGYALQGWFAPNITNDGRRGLGGRSLDDIVRYLRAGYNRAAAASGPMGEEVARSSSLVTEADLRAVAAYLKDQPDQDGGATTPMAADEPVMKAGGAIDRDECSACHTPDGSDVAELFPSLRGAPSGQSTDPISLLRVVLRGARSIATDLAPTAPGMPAFGWILNDEQVAAVITYVRNAWGNAAPAVKPGDVARAMIWPSETIERGRSGFGRASSTTTPVTM